MYQCKNCGGNLKFDISSQKLLCEHCSSKFDPYEIVKESDAEEDHFYEVTVFRCPQCGGEIYSTDNTAAGFCSFCGASTILMGRLSKEQASGYVIPFQKTKQDCKDAYTQMMRKAIFAPKALRSDRCIDGFRGMYMPYWVYHISQQGIVTLPFTKSYTSGNYNVTDYYNYTGRVDAQYKGISFDASSSFSDNISESVAPFNVKKMKKFTPSFLSGFYADTSDVEKETYLEDAQKFSTHATVQAIETKEMITFSKVEDSVQRQLKTTTKAVDTAMFPVWFMSYRNKGRVAYATVNGQTGKVVADIPVDIKKYIFGSILLAIPFFILLNCFFTVRPIVLLSIVSILTAITVAIYSVEMSEIRKRESDDYDKGIQSARERKKRKEIEKKKEIMRQAAAKLDGVESAASIEELVKEPAQIKFPKKQKNDINWIDLIAKFSGVIFFGIAIVLSNSLALTVGKTYAALIIIGISFVVTVICSLTTIKKNLAAEGDVDKFGSLFGVLAALSALVVTIMNPVSDLYYYGAVIIALVAEMIQMVNIIQNYNVLSTRRLPQFDYKGGDDRA